MEPGHPCQRPCQWYPILKNIRFSHTLTRPLHKSAQEYWMGPGQGHSIWSFRWPDSRFKESNFLGCTDSPQQNFLNEKILVSPGHVTCIPGIHVSTQNSESCCSPTHPLPMLTVM